LKILLSVCPPYPDTDRLLEFSQKVASALKGEVTALCVTSAVDQKYYSPFSIQLGRKEKEEEEKVFNRINQVFEGGAKMTRGGELVTQVLDEVERGCYDMLILGDMDKKLTKKLAEYSPVATLIFREEVDLKSLLCCVDGSQNSINSAHLAERMAEGLNARLTLLSIAEGEDTIGQARENIQETKRAMEGLSLVVEEKVRVGKVVDTILEEGRNHDLVALGPRGLSKFHRVFLGYVSLNVLEKSEGNVLVA